MKKKVIKFRGKLVFDESFPDGVPRKFLDTSKLKKLGWNPRIKLNEGIKMTYSWYLENIDWSKKVLKDQSWIRRGLNK